MYPLRGVGRLWNREGNTSNASYCLLVSSCDAYADSWPPFFTLLARFWPLPIPTIYLNTETQAFAFPGLDIHCPRVGLEAGHELAWGERLLACLARIPYEIVLYVQEDYFINDTVDVEMVGELVRLMERERTSHISLMPIARPGTRSEHRFLTEMDQRAEYRIAAQAGLWRRASLISYLRRHETVWEFEWYGTRRARRRRDSFFYVNEEYERARGARVIPYWPTGIQHGRWVREVVEDLFAAHDIRVDYASRGFYDPEDDTWGRRPLLVRAIRRLRSIR